MNFLAHFLLATEYLTAIEPRAAYVAGTALPDLLPLAAPQKRLRLVSLSDAPMSTPEQRAITQGVRVHLLTDAAFHKTLAFQEAQSRVGESVVRAGFVGIRVRRFFLAHVLTELALDAVLMRRQPGLADGFYRDFAATDDRAVTLWTATTVGQPVPRMSGVLRHFADARYLHSYAGDDGVAEGLRRLSLRARQDPFRGANFDRLARVVTEAVTILTDRADAMLSETATGVRTGVSD